MRTLLRASLLASFLFVSLTAAALADYRKGYEAYQKGDYPAAYREWSAAAGDGDVDAQAALGILYYKGWGVPQDFGEAGKWYRKAAEQGHAGAQNNLGMMYQEGLGVEADYVEAYVWFSLAAARGTADIQMQATENRDQIASRLTADEIQKAQKSTRDWKPAAAR